MTSGKVPATTEVLIVGAGPTGLMFANQLMRRGIEFLIIDRNAGPAKETRALGVQARTLEIYSHLGIADRAIELGKVAAGANLWVKGRRGARIPLSDIGHNLSPYPFLLILGQDDNERLLGELLTKRGIDVQWGNELIELEQQPDHVLATLKQSDGSLHKIRANWVGGCDGSGSEVRNLNKIAFPGAPYAHIFFVADTTATGPMLTGELNVYLWREGFHLFFPMRGVDHWRVVGIIPPELREHKDLQFDDLIPSIIQNAGIELKFLECSWFSTYRIHHRHAERFRDRRCFLMGDAAHIHSPVGAQGMNTGLQDAYNLAWKLALVISGQADQTLLDSYETERLPVAKRLLNGTDRAFSMVVSDRTISRIVRTRVLAKVAAFGMRFEPIRRFAFLTISQIGIHYRASSLSSSLGRLNDNAPQAGDRFPWMRLKFSTGEQAEDLFQRLNDTRFNLLIIGPSKLPGLDPEFEGLIDSHDIPIDVNIKELTQARIDYPCFYLLRPDGYIGLAGKQLEAGALSSYLKKQLRMERRL